MGPIIKRLATDKNTATGVADTYDFTMNGRQKARVYYRCSANAGGTPTVALALLPVIPDFALDAGDTYSTTTFNEGKVVATAWPVSTGSDETYVFPAAGAIGATTSGAAHNLMIMLETPVSELRLTVTVAGSGNLTYDLIVELV